MKSSRSKTSSDDDRENQITAYSDAQSVSSRTICEALRALIEPAFPSATSKVWHGSPVWFINENPVVGYNVSAKGVNLLFWNGRVFDEPGLQPVGKFQAAQAIFSNINQIDSKMVRRWLKKAKADVFDSKAFFKKMRETK
jgi:hypothetical protein